MKLEKSAIYWGLGTAAVVIVAVVAWWLWWSYTPYDESDPAVQEKLAQITELRQDIKEGEGGFVSNYIEIGKLYRELGDDRRELATYKKLARLRPQSYPPFTAMGEYYKQREQYGLAEKNMLKAIENDPDNVNLYYNLSFLYTYNLDGRDEDFEVLVLDSIAQYPIVEASLTQILGFYFKDTGSADKAREYLTKLLELAPERSSDWQQAINELDS